MTDKPDLCDLEPDSDSKWGRGFTAEPSTDASAEGTSIQCGAETISVSDASQQPLRCLVPPVGASVQLVRALRNLYDDVSSLDKRPWLLQPVLGQSRAGSATRGATNRTPRVRSLSQTGTPRLVTGEMTSVQLVVDLVSTPDSGDHLAEELLLADRPPSSAARLKQVTAPSCKARNKSAPGRPQALAPMRPRCRTPRQLVPVLAQQPLLMSDVQDVTSTPSTRVGSPSYVRSARSPILDAAAALPRAWGFSPSEAQAPHALWTPFRENPKSVELEPIKVASPKQRSSRPGSCGEFLDQAEDEGAQPCEDPSVGESGMAPKAVCSGGSSHSGSKEPLECAATAEAADAQIRENRKIGERPPIRAASTKERVVRPGSREDSNRAALDVQSEAEARRIKQAKIRTWLRRKDDEMSAKKEAKKQEVLRILTEVQAEARKKDEQQVEQRRQKLGRLQASARKKKDFELELLHACAVLTASSKAPATPRELPSGLAHTAPRLGAQGGPGLRSKAASQPLHCG